MKQNSKIQTSGTGQSSATKSAKSKPSTKSRVKQASDHGLADLFEAQLKDIYWAEKALLKALPKMAKNASTDALSEAFQKHLAETEGQVERLEEVFTMIGKKAQAKKCEAMNGLLEEAQEVIDDTEAGVVRDAAMICAAQKVEHYEIATYGTLLAWAGILGETDAGELLQETLDEEKSADEILNQLARDINPDAKDEHDEEDDDDEEENDTSENEQRGDVYVRTRKSGSKCNI